MITGGGANEPKTNDAGLATQTCTTIKAQITLDSPPPLSLQSAPFGPEHGRACVHFVGGWCPGGGDKGKEDLTINLEVEARERDPVVALAARVPRDLVVGLHVDARLVPVVVTLR